MHQVILRLKPGGWKKLPPGLEDHGLVLLFRQVTTGLPNGKEHLITTLNFQHTRVRACPVLDTGVGVTAPMRFLFSDPFIKVAGKELDFSISSPVSLRTLIGRLPPNLIEMIHHDPSVSA